ncbi:MAG: hypothetical protein PHY23_00010 [Oscillospiraceae bacterium]|nr:hypothetical protein [Oscillospiraceae bacterium]
MSERINAGYVITDSVFIGDSEFVIGANSTSLGTMYVTWQCKDGDNYFWGHYLSDRRAAEKDLLDRAGNELRLQRQQEQKSKNKERER